MRAALPLLASLPFAACASTPDALMGSDGRPIRKAAPAPYRIAVAPVEVDASVSVGGDGEEDKWFLTTGNPGELRSMLVDSLRDLEAGTEIAFLEEPPDAAGLDQVYDLVLVPRLTRADFEYTGASDQIWVSTGAWLLSWIGALWVSDAAYDSSVVMECDVYDPHSQARMVDPFVVSAGEQQLSYWSRNKAFTTGFFMTIVWPPFWARDKADVVSGSLTEGAIEQLAGQVKRYLVEDHDGRVSEDRFASVTFNSPRNGDTVGPSVDVSYRVRTRQPVLAVLMFRNGEPLQDGGGLTLSSLPAPEDQGRQGGYEFEMSATGIPTDPGQNLIRLVLILEGGRRTSRSIAVNQG